MRPMHVNVLEGKTGSFVGFIEEVSYSLPSLPSLSLPKKISVHVVESDSNVRMALSYIKMIFYFNFNFVLPLWADEKLGRSNVNSRENSNLGNTKCMHETKVNNELKHSKTTVGR